MKRSTIYTIASILSIVIIILLFHEKPKSETASPASLPTNGLVSSSGVTAPAATSPTPGAVVQPAAAVIQQQGATAPGAEPAKELPSVGTPGAARPATDPDAEDEATGDLPPGAETQPQPDAQPAPAPVQAQPQPQPQPQAPPAQQ